MSSSCLRGKPNLERVEMLLVNCPFRHDHWSPFLLPLTCSPVCNIALSRDNTRLWSHPLSLFRVIEHSSWQFWPRCYILAVDIMWHHLVTRNDPDLPLASVTLAFVCHHPGQVCLLLRGSATKKLNYSAHLDLDIRGLKPLNIAITVTRHHKSRLTKLFWRLINLFFAQSKIFIVRVHRLYVFLLSCWLRLERGFLARLGCVTPSHSCQDSEHSIKTTKYVDMNISLLLLFCIVAVYGPTCVMTAAPAPVSAPLWPLMKWPRCS